MLRSLLSTSRQRSVLVPRTFARKATPVPSFQFLRAASSSAATSSKRLPSNDSVDWDFYRTILGQPLLTTYESLQTIGYDAPWEVYLRFCDGDQQRFKTILHFKGKGPQAAQFKDLVKNQMRRGDSLYLKACWEALKNKKDGTEDSKAFRGGSFEEWQDWRETLRKKPSHVPQEDGHLEHKSDLNDPNWGLMSLLPPGPDEKRRWITHTRSSKQVIQTKVKRLIRKPTLPAPGVCVASVDVRTDTWTVGEPVTFCLVFDKDAQAMKALDQDGNEVCRPWTLQMLAESTWGQGFAYLAHAQGLLDFEKWKHEKLMWQMRTSLAHFDLATHLSNGVYLNFRLDTRPHEKGRKFFYTKLRLEALDKPPREDEGYIARWFTPPGESKDRLVQELHLTAHSKHLPESHRQQAPSLRKSYESRLINVPELPIDADNYAPIIPYISTVGAHASGDPEKPWLIDLVTPNTNPDPPTSLPSATSEELVTVLPSSGSPETLRFWSVDLGRDVYWSVRSGDVDKKVCRAALTAEDVKKRWKTLYAWARKKGYWKDAGN